MAYLACGPTVLDIARQAHRYSGPGRFLDWLFVSPSAYTTGLELPLPHGNAMFLVVNSAGFGQLSDAVLFKAGPKQLQYITRFPNRLAAAICIIRASCIAGFGQDICDRPLKVHMEN